MHAPVTFIASWFRNFCRVDLDPKSSTRTLIGLGMFKILKVLTMNTLLRSKGLKGKELTRKKVELKILGNLKMTNFEYYIDCSKHVFFQYASETEVKKSFLKNFCILTFPTTPNCYLDYSDQRQQYHTLFQHKAQLYVSQ